MVFRWRRAFCTSVPREPDSSNPLHSHTDSTPSLRCRTTTSSSTMQESASVPVSPKRKTTNNSPKLFHWSSTPSSPRSPSTFAILKSNLRISTNRCGLCLHSVKLGRGVAIFTAECSHRFHFPCIAGYMKKQGSLTCPTCGSIWKDMPLLCVNNHNQKHHQLVTTELKKSQTSFVLPDLKVYNDDEPLASLTPKARFNPIPESDESCDEDSIGEFVHAGDVDVRLLPEAAVISTGRSYETHAVILRVKAPAMRAQTHRRAPIDLVTVVDVSSKMTDAKLKMMKRMMRMIISSLSSSDRLSIVAFASYSKRLLHLKRMTSTGKRAASRIVEAMAVIDGSSNATVAVKKAAKVLDDRREKNVVASVILLSDVSGQSSYVSSTRYLNVNVHTLKLTEIDDHAFMKTVGGLLNVTVQDLQLRLGFVSGSAPAEIGAVYEYGSYTQSVANVSSTSAVQIGELYGNEERDLLVELKVPSPGARAYTVLSVHCSYTESITQEVIYCNEHALVVPRPHYLRHNQGMLSIQRLRNVFITTRAIAESRRLAGQNNLIGAYHMLISARATMLETNSNGGEFLGSIEAELNELQRRRQAEAHMATYVEENSEALTPTSAWRVAEKLANVAIIKKSLNRVSDLHGFEDARF